MTLSDIFDAKACELLNVLVREGFEVVRVSFERGYLPVGHTYVSYGHDRNGRYTAAIHVPNRRTSVRSNRYGAVIRLVNFEDLPF